MLYKTSIANNFNQLKSCKMMDFKHVDYGNHLTELQMGVVFNETADGHGDTSNLCIQLSYNKFHCWMNSTSWKIESETDYFGDTFVTKSMNRFVFNHFDELHHDSKHFPKLINVFIWHNFKNRVWVILNIVLWSFWSFTLLGVIRMVLICRWYDYWYKLWLSAKCPTSDLLIYVWTMIW